MWTPQFDRFVAPARSRPQLWRLFAGFGLIVAGYVLGFLMVLAGLVATMGLGPAQVYLASLPATGGTPTLVVLMLALFAAPLLAAILAARLLHGRGPETLFGAGLLAGFARSAMIAAFVYGAVTLLLPVPFEAVPGVPLPIFLSFLPLALVVLLIQTGAEEVVFRGYLQSQLAARFRHPLVWMVVPALCFGLLHADPTGGPDKLWLLLPPTLFGLIAADLTRVTGSIGAAWGLHFANNASAILLISLDGNLSGLALYRTPFGADDLSLANPLVWQDMTVTVIVWACIRLWLARGRPAPSAAE